MGMLHVHSVSVVVCRGGGVIALNIVLLGCTSQELPPLQQGNPVQGTGSGGKGLGEGG